MRVAWGGTLGLPYEPAVLDAFDRRPARGRPLGVELVEGEPDVRGADEVFRVLRGWHMATTIGDAVERAGEASHRWCGRTSPTAAPSPPASWPRPTSAAPALLAAAAGFFGRHEFLLLPVSQVLPFDVATTWPRDRRGASRTTWAGCARCR